MSTNEPNMTEAELMAAYEAEIKKLRIEHVLLENVVTVINLGMRRTGLMQGTESERDPDQVRLAIEAVRSLLPVLEAAAPEQVPALRQALSQLQMAYVQVSGGAQEAPPEAAGAGPAGPPPPPAPAPPTGEPPVPGEEQPPGPGPAQRSGRLWIPGQ